MTAVITTTASKLLDRTNAPAAEYGFFGAMTKRDWVPPTWWVPRRSFRAATLFNSSVAALPLDHLWLLPSRLGGTNPYSPLRRLSTLMMGAWWVSLEK